MADDGDAATTDVWSRIHPLWSVCPCSITIDSLLAHNVDAAPLLEIYSPSRATGDGVVGDHGFGARGVQVGTVRVVDLQRAQVELFVEDRGEAGWEAYRVSKKASKIMPL